MQQHFIATPAAGCLCRVVFRCSLACLWMIAATETASAEGVSFVRDVVPVLTRAGCNGGACHGSFQGRGGFALSLLGFDPAADFESLVNAARGRRISATHPSGSLMLRKASGLMPHGGGQRVVPGSESFEILRRWLTDGAQSQKTPLTVTALQVDAGQMLLRQDEKQQISVRATWSDGVTQDVTRWALLDSRDSDVAEVASPPISNGQIQAKGPGRTAITIRFMGQVATSIVTVPFVTDAKLPAVSPRNFIDGHIIAEWNQVGLIPQAEADDATFLRRVSLDLIGALPTPAEVRAFLAATETDKRARLIDALLNRPEYVDYWTMKWSDLLRAHRRALGEKGLGSFQGWLRSAIREGKPADALVRELLTAQGNLCTNGPVGFFFVDQTPQDLAETTSQIFLGVRMQCARCHHHPFEVWAQDDYYGLAAFFASVQRKDTKENGRYGGAQSIFLSDTQTLPHPVTGQPIAPRVLGAATPVAGGGDSRPALAEWITQPSNPYFAKNLVNRYWGYLFGRGLVEPIDDLRATNPASHPKLLDELANDFVQQRYDFRHLLRTICNSRTYQLATNLTPERDRGDMFYTFYLPRRLAAEVLLDAISQATGTNESFASFPPGTKAIALPDSTVASYFLDTFGRPKRTGTCECERVVKPDLSQSLHLSNGEGLHQKIASKEGRIARLLATQKSDDDLIMDLYLATLSRSPTEAEKSTVRRVVAAAAAKQEAFEDVLWALINCSEFSFQH